jgi:hypothetical protein
MSASSQDPHDSIRRRRISVWSIWMTSLGLLPVLAIGVWFETQANASPPPAAAMLAAPEVFGLLSDDTDTGSDSGDSGSDDSSDSDSGDSGDSDSGDSGDSDSGDSGDSGGGDSGDSGDSDSGDSGGSDSGDSGGSDSGDSGDSGSSGCGVGGSSSVTPGVSVCGYVELRDSARLSAASGTLIVATNSTSSEQIKVKGSATIDGNVYVGVGGNVNTVVKLEGSGSITGSIAVLDGNVEVPVITAPSGMGSSVGNRTYSSGTTTISSNLYCNKFEIKSSATVQISGNVTILADDEFKIKDQGQLTILTGGALTVYAKKDFKLESTAKFNVNTADASVANVLLLGGKDVEFKGSSVAYATIIGAGSKVTVKGTAELYGTVKAKKVAVQDQGKLIVDTSAAKKLVLKSWGTKSGSDRKGATRTKVNTVGFVKPSKDVNHVGSLSQDDGN